MPKPRLEMASLVAAPRTKLQASRLSGHKTTVLCLCLRNGYMLSGSSGGQIRLWNVETGRTEKAIVWRGEVNSVAFHPKKDGIIFAASGVAIASFDLNVDGILVTKPLKLNKNAANDEINAICVDEEKGFSLAVADDMGEIRMFNTTTLKLVVDKNRSTCIGKHENIACCMARHPMSKDFRFVTGALDATFKTWSGKTRKRLLRVQVTPCSAEDASGTSGGSGQLVNPPLVHSISYSPDGTRILVGCGDGTIGVYNANTGVCHTRLSGGHASAVAQVAYTKSSKIVSGGNDKYICVWNGKGGAGELPFVRFLHSEPINFFACGEGNNTLYVAGLGKNVISYSGECFA